MTLQNYFLELKNRVVLLFISWVTLIFVSYFFKEVLLNVITNDLADTTMKTTYFIFTNITEIFTVHVLLIFFISNQILIIYFFYHLLIFTLPGFRKSEYNFFKSIFIICNLLFFLSIIVFNIFLFPTSWNFFLSFQNFTVLKSFMLHFEAKLLEYVTFYITFYYYCISYFQFFLFPILFFKYIDKETRLYSRFRKFLYYFCFIFSTLTTPPDILSQVALSFSFIISCEISVLFLMFKTVLKHKN